jgi:hypothetical protein
MGREPEAWEEKALERQKSRRAAAADGRQLPLGVNGLVRRRKASQRVKLMRTRRLCRHGSRSYRETRCLQRVERELWVGRGSRQLRWRVDVGETVDDEISWRYVSEQRWITAREQVASREARDSCEGKALKEENPRDGCGTKQGREAWACQETAERLREPESGTEAGVTSRLRRG